MRTGLEGQHKVLRVEVPESLIRGDVDDGYGSVADAFRRNFAELGEIGAACAVYREGRKVVDLWGGYRDGKERKPWDGKTILVVFSASKGMASAAMAAKATAASPTSPISLQQTSSSRKFPSAATTTRPTRGRNTAVVIRLPPLSVTARIALSSKLLTCSRRAHIRLIAEPPLGMMAAESPAATLVRRAPPASAQPSAKAFVAIWMQPA